MTRQKSTDDVLVHIRMGGEYTVQFTQGQNRIWLWRIKKTKTKNTHTPTASLYMLQSIICEQLPIADWNHSGTLQTHIPSHVPKRFALHMDCTGILQSILDTTQYFWKGWTQISTRLLLHNLKLTDWNHNSLLPLFKRVNVIKIWTYYRTRKLSMTGIKTFCDENLKISSRVTLWQENYTFT